MEFDADFMQLDGDFIGVHGDFIGFDVDFIQMGPPVDSVQLPYHGWILWFMVDRTIVNGCHVVFKRIYIWGDLFL